MSARIKGLLAVLALGALVSVWYVGSLLKPAGGLADISTQVGSVPANPCAGTPGLSGCDPDHDGLSTGQEAYWHTDPNNPDTDGDGFKDGEEVLSGHDPLKKGPDDLLNNKQNLSQKASNLLMGAMLSGDLDPNASTYAQSVQHLADSVFQQYQDNNSFEPESFQTGSDSRAAIISYGFKMSLLMKSTFTDTAAGYATVINTIKTVPLDKVDTLSKDDPTTYAAFTAAIKTETAALNDRISQVKGVTVPPSMSDAEKNILMLLQGARQQYQSLLNLNSDPLQAIISMQVLASITTSSVFDVITDFSGRLGQALTTSQ